eukprot:15167-Hanusia_phi.AAC.2
MKAAAVRCRSAYNRSTANSFLLPCSLAANEEKIGCKSLHLLRWRELERKNLEEPKGSEEEEENMEGSEIISILPSSSAAAPSLKDMSSRHGQPPPISASPAMRASRPNHAPAAP